LGILIKYNFNNRLRFLAIPLALMLKKTQDKI